MFQRPKYLNQLVQFKDTDFIKVITSVRRSGKSVLLMLYKEYLESIGVSAEQIIYMNFENFEYQTITDENQLREILIEKLPKDGNKMYLLLDEIQFVSGWQKVINGVRVSFNSDIVITGSNGNMLSGELATLLSGRYIVIHFHLENF